MQYTYTQTHIHMHVQQNHHGLISFHEPDFKSNIDLSLTFPAHDLRDGESGSLGSVQAAVKLHHQTSLSSQDSRDIVQGMDDVVL